MVDLLHDERIYMPPAEREKYLAEGLRQISEYAYKNAPAMKKKFDEAGFDPSRIRSTRDLEKIPVTTRDDFIKAEREAPPFGGFLAVPLSSLKRIYIHPGPQYETLSDSDIEHVRGTLNKLGIRSGDIALNALSYHLVPAGILVDEVLTSLGITLIPTGVGNTDLQIQVMHDLKVTAFVGFPSFLMMIIQRAEELGYDFRRDFTLRKALALGTSEVRKSLEEDYGLDTREVYAFLPVGVPCVECDQKLGTHIEEDFILEIVDPNTKKQLGPGEVGEIVITTIFNEILPRIRFGSGDLGYYTDEPCPCGRTSDRLVKVVGRVGEAVKLRGMFVHPLEVADVASHLPQLAKVQVVATRDKLRDVLHAKFELADENADKEKLVEAFQKDFQSRCRLRLDTVEFVPRGTIPPDAREVVDERKEIVL